LRWQLGAPTGDSRLNRTAALCAVLAAAPARVLGSAAAAELGTTLRALVADARAEVRMLAVRAAGLLIAHGLTTVGASPAFIELLASAARDESSDVRRCALSVLKRVAKHAPADALSAHLPVLLPPAVDALNDRVGPVKLLAERTVRRCCWPTSTTGGVDAAAALLQSAGASPALRAKLTDAVLRRLSKLPDGSDDDAEL
jgi:hypothetical protein